MGVPVRIVAARDFAPALLDREVRVDVARIGTAVPMDYHDRVDREHLVWFVLAGEVAVTSGGTSHIARARTAFWVPPGRRHSEEAQRGTRVFYVRFSVAGLAQRPREELVATRSVEHVRFYLDELHRAVRFARDLQACQVRALLGCLLVEIVRNADHGDQGVRDDRRPLSDQQLEAVLGYVRSHIGEAVTSGDLARQVGLSLAYFASRFKRTVGLTPRSWLVQQRMLAAADLLSEGAGNISEVAAAVGCHDPNLFSRQFRAQHGISPGAFARHGR